MTPIDPDPVASFRQLIALPPGAAREAPRIDPRRIRTIVDRGVVEYASAKTDGDRARGARLIQTAALVGYPPARDLLARNYPQSEAVRSVVPAKDVIRYALVPVMAAASEDSKQIFFALGQHFALQGQLDLFATEILEFTARRLAPAAHSSGRHFSGLAGARARCVWRARAPGTGRRQGCRSRMLFQRKSAQVHRNDTAVRCGGGGGVKAPRFVDVESARRTLARRASVVTWTGTGRQISAFARDSSTYVTHGHAARLCYGRCDAGPRHRLREKYAVAVSGAKRSFSQNNAIAVRRPVNETTFRCGQHPTTAYQASVAINCGSGFLSVPTATI